MYQDPPVNKSGDTTPGHAASLLRNTQTGHLTCINWAGLKSLDAWSSCMGAETFGLCSKEWPFSAPFTRLNQAAASALVPVE